jgi:predicted nucleotidyltransferase
MKAFNFYSQSLPVAEIDIVIESPIPYNELKDGAVKIEVQGTMVPVVSIHDLIELKTRTGREQDLADVEHLKRVLEK